MSVRTRRLPRAIARAASFALGLWLVWCTVLGVAIWTYDAPALVGQVDAAVILGARVEGDRPSPVFGARIEHAIELVLCDRAGALLCTGGASGGGLAEGQVARRVAIEAGIAPHQILFEERSQSTYESLVEVRRMAHAESLETLAIVSDPLHMRRAMTMAKHLGLHAVPAPTPATRIRSLGQRLAFACRETMAYSAYLALRALRLLGGSAG